MELKTHNIFNEGSKKSNKKMIEKERVVEKLNTHKMFNEEPKKLIF